MLGDDPAAELLGPFPHPASYVPMPFYLSTAGYALSLDGTGYSTFDFGASEIGTVRVEGWGGPLAYTPVVRATPKEALTRAAQTLGLPELIPRAAFAPWNDAVGGWMADFGEYTPFDSVAFDGEAGATHHNRVPVLWPGLQREFLEMERPDGDWLTFAGSGFTGSRGEVAVVWGDDQDSTFSEQDGLPAAL